MTMAVADIRASLAKVGGPAALLPRTIPILPRGRHATKVAYRMGYQAGWVAAGRPSVRRRSAVRELRPGFSGTDYSGGQECAFVGSTCYRWDHAHKRRRTG